MALSNGTPVADGAAASPPVFEQIFRNARFAQGGNAFFEGRVNGNPTPQVVWTRKGLQMKGQRKLELACSRKKPRLNDYITLCRLKPFLQPINIHYYFVSLHTPHPCQIRASTRCSTTRCPGR